MSIAAFIACDTPRRFAPPLLIEGIQTHAAEYPLYQEGCPQGGVCKNT